MRQACDHWLGTTGQKKVYGVQHVVQKNTVSLDLKTPVVVAPPVQSFATRVHFVQPQSRKNLQSTVSRIKTRASLTWKPLPLVLEFLERSPAHAGLGFPRCSRLCHHRQLIRAEVLSRNCSHRSISKHVASECARDVRSSLDMSLLLLCG